MRAYVLHAVQRTSCLTIVLFSLLWFIPSYWHMPRHRLSYWNTKHGIAFDFNFQYLFIYHPHLMFRWMLKLKVSSPPFIYPITAIPAHLLLHSTLRWSQRLVILYYHTEYHVSCLIHISNAVGSWSQSLDSPNAVVFHNLSILIPADQDVPEDSHHILEVWLKYPSQINTARSDTYISLPRYKTPRSRHIKNGGTYKVIVHNYLLYCEEKANYLADTRTPAWRLLIRRIPVSSSRLTPRHPEAGTWSWQRHDSS